MSKSLKIDKEFKSLIPPLLEDERKQLEENCVRDGIKDSLVTWNGILIDGHNRYEIAKKHGLDFKVTEMEFSGREDAKLWIIKNQLGRRNLSAYDRSSLALKLKPLFADRAKANQIASGGAVPQKSAKPIDTREELAKVAGVSHDTIHKVEVIENSGTEEVIDKVKNREMSINKAYHQIKGTSKKKATQPQIEVRDVEITVTNEDVMKNSIQAKEAEIETDIIDKHVKEEPLPFEKYVATEPETTEHNENSNEFLSKIMADINRLADMDSTYGVDVIQELKNSNLSGEKKQEFESCVERCIKALAHLKTGLLLW